MDVYTSRRPAVITQAILILAAATLLPLAACDRGYRFIASPADDVITLPPLSNGWRPVVSTATWRQHQTTTAGARHPVHSRVQQHLRSNEARKRVQAAESNKVEVFAPAPPSILGSFSLVGKPRRHKVAEQEELLPQGRIVYSARLVPPPVQTPPSGASRDQYHGGLTPPPKTSAIHYSKPTSLELYPSYLSKYEDPRPAVSSTAFSSSGHGIYLDPSHNQPNQYPFKTLPDSLKFFKDFFDKHKAAYADALSAQKLLDKQKSQPVIESVELGKEVFYGKDVGGSSFTNFNDYGGKFLSQFSIKNPSEVEIVHEKRLANGLYPTPSPEIVNYNNNLPSRATNNYNYQAGVLTTPFSNPSHVYTSPTPSPLIQPTFPTNNFLNPTSTIHPPVQNEFKLSPVQFVPPTSVSLQPQGENGRIPRPYHNDKRVNENVPVIFPVTNGHAPAQHELQKPASVYNNKDTFVTFLPTIPPEIQTVVPEQGYEGHTSQHSILNEVTPIPGRGKVTFKQSPLDPLSSLTPLTSIDSSGTLKPDRPYPTNVYKETDQTLFGTQKPDTVTFISEVSTVEPAKGPLSTDVSRPHVRNPDRNRHRLKPTRRPSNNLGGIDQNNIQRQRNPQRTRQPIDNSQQVQSQQQAYFSSTPFGEGSTFENDQNIIPPPNHRPHVDTDTGGNDMEINDGDKYSKTKPNRIRRPPVRQNENDYSEESRTEDNIHSSTQAYYTRGPDAQKLVRGNYDSEGTDMQDQSVDKEKAYSSRRPGSQTRHTTRPQQFVRNNELLPTRSPQPSRRRPQSQRDNPDVKDNDGYQNLAYQGTRTHRPRRPSSNRGQASYNTNNGYDRVRGRPNQRQRPLKSDITDATEIEEESERESVSSVQNNRNQASHSQSEADNSNSYVYSHRRKPSNGNYVHIDHQEEATLLNHHTNDDGLPGSPTLTNEVTSQAFSTTVRPIIRYPPTQKLNKGKNNVPSSTNIDENNDVPITRIPSHDTEFNYDHAESYEHSYHTNFKAGEDNTYSTNNEHKNFGKSKNSAFAKDSVTTYENTNEFSFDLTTTVEPVRTSTSTTTTTIAPTTTAPTMTTSATTTTSTTTSTAATSALPPITTETDLPLETSTATTTSTSTDSHSSLFVPSKLRPRLRPGTNSSRPRFSIKEYRQRLNKQREGETQDDDEENNDEEKPSGTYHARYPSRTRGSETYRREPGGSTSTTTEASRSRYRSDRPRTSTRFRTTTTTTKRPEYAASTEKTGSFRPNTSRFKPGTGKFYSRYRTSTTPSVDKPDDESTSNVSSTSPPRILMNPKGVFSAMRRIYPLKMLTSSQKNTTSKEESAKLGSMDMVHTLPPTFVITPQSSTEAPGSSSTTERVDTLMATSLDEHAFFQNSHGRVESNVMPSTPREDEAGPTSTPGSVELQSPSQIVAGLTSAGAASGLFKSAQSLSARPAFSITMATEEPRLPIEAFFPVLAGKDRYS